MDVQEMSPDPAARRRRRTRLLFIILAAALATALFGDWLLGWPAPAHKSAMREPIAHAKAKLFGRSHQGITSALGTPNAFNGKGGPEDPGAYIEEDKHPHPHGWNLAFGNMPVDGFAHAGFTLPSKGGISGGPFQGFGGGSGGGGGGGSGGMILNCTDIQALGPQVAGKFGCPPPATDSNPQAIADNSAGPGGSTQTTSTSSFSSSGSSGGSMMTNPASSSSGGSENGLPGTNSSGDANQPVPLIPTAAVPEPANWLTLIAGFFFIGALLRQNVARMRRTHSDRLEA